MNKIEKQCIKQKKKQNNSVRKWWRKNAHKVARVIFFYIWLPCFIYEKIKDAKYKKLTYNNNLTKKYLDRVLPKLVAHYEEDPNVILFHNCEDFGGIRFYWDLCSNWMKKKFFQEK